MQENREGGVKNCTKLRNVIYGPPLAIFVMTFKRKQGRKVSLSNHDGIQLRIIEVKTKQEE
jgi:hypothetical protein